MQTFNPWCVHSLQWGLSEWIDTHPAQHCLLLAPAGMGKTGYMVWSAAAKPPHQHWIVMDCSEVKSLPEFYMVWFEALQRECDRMLIDYSSLLEPHFPVPQLLRPGRQHWPRLLSTTEKLQLLNWPQRMAKKRKQNITVILDSMEVPLNLSGSAAEMRQCRAVWQSQSKVQYVIAGRPTAAMLKTIAEGGALDGFANSLEYLVPVASDWYTWMQSQAGFNPKTHRKEELLAVLEACHSPAECRQLAEAVLRGCTPADAIQMLTERLNPVFRELAKSCTRYQWELILAIHYGESRLSTKKVAKSYELGTQGNLRRMKAALETRGILDFSGTQPRFVLPFFRQWLTQTYP
ncbi:MAG: hypothetical protein JNL57_05180 [Bacteroidetes bacterium]|nr:hypothetical protein [Bacteroidota bacterium]